MQDIIIRRAVIDDIPAINRLLYQVNQLHSDLRPDLFKANAKKYTDSQLGEIILNDETPVFVAESDGTVAGYAFCIHIHPPKGANMTDIEALYIDDLCVDEKLRGKHIGARLYEAVVSYAKLSGCHNITLNAWSGNLNAIRFYEKMGLKPQKICMEKILQTD